MVAGTLALILLVALLLGEAALAFVVLARSGGQAAARVLAAYLLMHSIVFVAVSAVAAAAVASPDSSGFFQRHEATTLLIFLLIGALPALLIHFSVTFPQPARRRVLGVAAGYGGFLLFSGILVAAALGRPPTFSLGGGQTIQVSAHVGILLFYLAGAVAAALVFFARARRAQTDLERRRLLFMGRAVAVPLAVAGASVIASIASTIVRLVVQENPSPDLQPVEAGLAFVGFLIMAVVPPVALAYGLLRHRILDLDLTLRLGIRRGVIGSAFVAAFFAGTQVAEALLQNALQSSLVGILIMLPLFFLLHPMQRLGDRIADRAVPRRSMTDAYRQFRRWEVYRATYEDLSGDRVVTPGERRTLEALARSLRLADDEVAEIETQVKKERERGPSWQAFKTDATS